MAAAFSRVLAVARRIGVPVVFLGYEHVRRRRSLARIRKEPARHNGPHLDTWIRWRHGRAVVFVEQDRGMPRLSDGEARGASREWLEERPHLLAHEIAHAWIWTVAGVDPRQQDEYAAFLPVSRAIVKAARLPERTWGEWMSNSGVPGTDLGWGEVSRAQRARLYRIGHACLREGAWTHERRELVAL